MTDQPHSILDRAGLDRAHRRRRRSPMRCTAPMTASSISNIAQSEGLVFDNGRLKAASFDTNQGFGLRAVAGEAAGYAHSGEISEAAIRRAGDAVQAVKAGHRAPMPRRRAAPIARSMATRTRSAPDLRREGEAARGDRRLCPRPGTRACAR